MSAKTKQQRTQTESPFNPRLVKAMAHPLRQKILQALNERVASPSQLAEELGDPLTKVSYHVKILLEYEAIELVRTELTGASVQHFYRATTRVLIDDEHWQKLPASVQSALFDHTLQQTWQHLVDASREDGFEESRTHLSWTSFDLDEQAYQEITDLLMETLERAMEIQAGAISRAGELSPEDRDAHKTELAIQHFHRATTAAASKRRKKAGAPSRESKS